MMTRAQKIALATRWRLSTVPVYLTVEDMVEEYDRRVKAMRDEHMAEYDKKATHDRERYLIWVNAFSKMSVQERSSIATLACRSYIQNHSQPPQDDDSQYGWDGIK